MSKKVFSLAKFKADMGITEDHRIPSWAKEGDGLPTIPAEQVTRGLVKMGVEMGMGLPVRLADGWEIIVSDDWLEEVSEDAPTAQTAEGVA